ncbi:MAG: outer membrane beta-barrel protein [Gammaproteobacteria bacterium]|nr:outer membrane beta-barrel protein [Gammaproteobacteria bacterium]
MPVCALATTHTWQGPYVGVFLGGGFGNNHMFTNAGSVTDTSYFTTLADINAVNNDGTWSQHPGTAIAGIQAGHDWAWKQIAYGVVLDYGTVRLSSSSIRNNTYLDNSDQYSIDTSMQTNWLFTLRGRLGYAPQLYLPSLLYLTGGMAVTQLKASNDFSDNSAFSGIGSSNVSQNQIGWTAGAGIEVAAFNHVSVNFEYLYVEVPSITTTGSISNSEGGFGIPVQSMRNSLSTTTNFHANLFKVGLNYRFDE